MILARRTLNQWLEGMRIWANEEQKTTILGRFGTEPEPYEWSEQDISIQIRNFFHSGVFVKELLDSEITSQIYVDTFNGEVF